MEIETVIDSAARVDNAGGLYHLTFPYMSSVGKTTESLSVQVPIKSEHPSPDDKKALIEALKVQGGLGTWTQKDDGSVWLVPSD